MLQSNHDNTPLNMTVFDPSPMVRSGVTHPVVAPCSTTEKLIGLVEEITGWKVAFEESSSSLSHRSLPGSQNDPARGTFAITDMSEHWPAKKPTGHRGKCDLMVSLIGELVEQLQSTTFDLQKSQSTLAALDPDAAIEDVNLVDSFVPKFGRRATDDVVENEFEVHQPVPVTVSPVCPPFEGWTLGGATGIVGDFYLDWLVDDEERISLCAGEIEFGTVEGGKEVSVCIDPLTNEYRFDGAVSDQSEATLNESGSQPIQNAFYLWDSACSQLLPIEASENWKRLKSGQAIVATTAARMSKLECWKDLDEGFSDVEDLATMLKGALRSTDPLLILKRN